MRQRPDHPPSDGGNCKASNETSACGYTQPLASTRGDKEPNQRCIHQVQGYNCGRTYKGVTAEKFNRFRDQMGLVDIGDKIKDDKDQRDQEEKGDNYSYLFDEAIPGHTSAHV